MKDNPKQFQDIMQGFSDALKERNEDKVLHFIEQMADTNPDFVETMFKIYIYVIGEC